MKNNHKQSDEKTGRGPEQTFSQRHADGQQVHGKVLKITRHQGNANQNHTEIIISHC